MQNVRAFNITARGASHIKTNKVCQDSSDSHDCDDNIAFTIVCDGHGGDDYVRSDIGSKEAVLVAGSCIVDFVTNVLKQYDLGYLQRHYEEVLRGLSSSIICKWRENIECHFSENPLTEEELSKISDKAKRKYLRGDVASAYGTTLIAVAFTDNYWFGIKIGDGKCVAISKEGIFSTPIPDDGICFLNATTSMCDKNAIDNFRYTFSFGRPAAVFIGTDGIDDCFNRDEQLFNLYKTVLYSFISSDYEQAKVELEEYLPRLSAKGSGDDVSIGAVIDFEISKKLDMIVNFDYVKKVVVEKKCNESEVEEKISNVSDISDAILSKPSQSVNNQDLDTDCALISDFFDNDSVNKSQTSSDSEEYIVPVSSSIVGNEVCDSKSVEAGDDCKELIGYKHTYMGEYVRIDNSRVYKLAPPILEVKHD